MFTLQHTPGRTVIADGKEYLFFSGYSYLGMHHVPEFAALVKEGIDTYGWMFPSSRISNTQLELFNAFEEKLSAITGMEATVCFSSGFLAGRAVIALLKDTSYSCAPGSHPAICPEKNTGGTFEEWTHDTHNATVLLFDSVNPLQACINDAGFLDRYTKNITCVIDDSHGAGLINNGRGIGGSLPRTDHINYILTYSLSKACNLGGGAVSCSATIAAQLKASPFYTASTSISPALAYAFLNGQHLYTQQRDRLKHNIRLFRNMTANRFASHEELPVFVLPSSVDEKKLEDAGIIISSFAYPDPGGEKIKRVVLNALHTESDLQQLADALKK